MKMDDPQGQSNYRWYILILGALTNALVGAAPGMSMSVLFKEISGDLHLSLVQVGIVWGIGSLPGMVSILLGGIIGDRLGPKRVLLAACLLAGAAGALRGVANGFITLIGVMLLYGFFAPLVVMNVLKNCGLWFSRKQLGLASGVASMGMAMGFLIGSLFSATVLSPWLGGWRQVMFLYGGLAMLLGIPWYFTRPAPIHAAVAADEPAQKPLRQTMVHLVGIRNLWLFGLAILGVSGSIQAVLGYLPLHLRGLGWPAANADGAAAAFHTISMIFVLPIALWSDKLGTRKKVLLAAGLMITLGMGLLSVANGALVWAAVCLAGMARDGFMAVFMTAIIETRGVGVVYAGTATGMVMVFSNIGNLILPPVGNSLAAAGAGLPFVFWASLTLAGVVALLATKEDVLQLAPVAD
jgi:MFS family permease